MDEMEKIALRQKVLGLIGAVSGRDPAALEPGQHLMADLSIDSPKALQLLMDIEENLEIEIPDDDAARFERVGDLVDYTVARAAGGAGG
jgi:acyl carrier protein